MSCRLNHVCIRDILLFMEEKMNYKHLIVKMEEIIDALKDKYGEDCIDYHCRLIDRTGFIASSYYGDGMGRYSGFSWEGHEYIDNIRDPKAWNMLKNGTLGISSMSLDVVKELAKELLINWGKSKLGIK